jgi:excisionase family DNA binding protein
MAKKEAIDTVLYDVMGVSELLGVRPETVRKYIRLKKLPAVRLGRHFWVKQETLKQWLDGQLPWQKGE